MAPHDFDDDELLRALRAPGTPQELADEDQYVAMFRAARPVASSRKPRVASRLGAGTALAVVLGVTGSGVAAAYTRSLPEPIQEFAHRVLGPVGAPAAPDHETRTAPSATASPRSTPPSATPASTPSSTPQSPSSDPSRTVPEPETSKRPSPSARPSTAAPAPSAAVSSPTASAPTDSASPSPVETSTTPTGTPSASASPAPSSSPSPSTSPSASASTTAVAVPAPAAISIDGSARVDVGQTASFSGLVTDEAGNPVVDVRVTLQRRAPEGWARVAWASTDDAGAVALSLSPVTGNAIVRLRTQHIRSDPWRITMRPVLTLSQEPSTTTEDGVVISAVAQGGQAGDRVELLALRKERWKTVNAGVLAEDGSIRFVVTPHRRQVTYAVVLARTEVHAEARGRIVVTAQDARGSSR